MSRTAKEYTGQTFGRWKVLARAGYKGKYHASLCRCECGNEKIVKNYVLVSGESKSCGCLRIDVATDTLRRLNLNKSHGMAGTKTYNSWKHSTVRTAWPIYQDFLDFMGEKPEGHRVDRRDRSKPHGPENTYWKPLGPENTYWVKQ